MKERKKIIHKNQPPSTKTQNILLFNLTRPKPVDHGYVFSMAVGTIGEWLKLVPFFC